MIFFLIFISTFILFFILTPGIMGKIPTKGDKFTVAIVHAILFSIIFSIVFHIFSKSGKYKEGLELKYCEKSVGGTCEPVRTRCSGTGKCTTTKSGKTTCDTKCTTTGGRCDPVRTQADTKACSGTYNNCNNENGRFVCQNSEGVSQIIGSKLEDRVACTRNEECLSGKCDNMNPGVFLCRPRVSAIKSVMALPESCSNWRVDKHGGVVGLWDLTGVCGLDNKTPSYDITDGTKERLYYCGAGSGALSSKECIKD